ncbi:RE1-silencing transcription factor-like isoform X1 [Pieris napi]|uniref:RE1-silencing transcription factor-like isoform X1 n=1 Tax=Pieris napi TaxID=78633 RepID=UPI001FBB665D|nr:RE1-silencing transcription factor-like isoform X1 [Pieris napi]
MESRKDTLTMAKMCRFCLTQTTPLKSLYSKNKTNKDALSLKFKVLSCLSYEVFPSDRMPTYICDRCKFFMNSFYEFKKICRQSEELVLKFIRNGKAFEPVTWPKALSKVYDSSKDVVNTIIEGGTTVQVSSLDTSESEDEDANVYNVQIGDDDEAKTTQVKIVTTDNIEKKAKKDTVETETRVAEGCWPCEECHRTYPLEQLLTLHKMRQHNRPKLVECDMCDSKFFSKSDLTIHQQRHSDETPFPCVACDHKFKRLILLKRHERLVHSDLPQHSCPSCPATFISVEELTSHQERHAKRAERSYVCDVCDKTFAVRSTLQRHIAVLHKREPQFNCEYCPERFGSVSKLSRHLRTHAGERPYPCKYCNKSFIKSQHYTRHLRVKHRDEMRTGQSPDELYRCEQCEETFANQDELIFHSAIHATQNLTCPLCQEKFDNVDDVTTHIKSHVNGVEFMCEYCELVFTTKEKYDNHLMLAHEDEIHITIGDEDSSMEVDGEDYEDDASINVKEDGDSMVIEIKKADADSLMMSEELQADEDEVKQDTNSEASETELPEQELVQIEATIEKITAKPSEEIIQSVAPLAEITRVKPNAGSDSQIIVARHVEEKRKVEVVETEPVKKVKAKAESTNSAGFTDKSLRLLEKELQDLKRTNARPDIGKSTPKIQELPKIRRTQVITSTPKLKLNEERKSFLVKSPAVERKTFEKRLTKENKEPQKDDKKEKDEEKREVEKKDKEVKEIPKSLVKNGSEKSDEVRRSSRPSRVKDYAKMVGDHLKGNSEEDSDSEEDDEEYIEGSLPEIKIKRRTSFKAKVQPVTSPSPGVTPTPRKRGRPRKDANKEVPEKIKKEDTTSNDVKEIEEKSNNGKKVDKSSTPTTPVKEPPTIEQKSPSSDVILSPTGQTLKKVPIKALPPGVKPMPLPMNARPQRELCEMQIGKKFVKVQKIVMTKSDVEAMAKQGLLEMKDGNMVLKPGIKLPTNTLNKEIKETPKRDKAAPTRCEIVE